LQVDNGLPTFRRLMLEVGTAPGRFWAGTIMTERRDELVRRSTPTDPGVASDPGADPTDSTRPEGSSPTPPPTSLDTQFESVPRPTPDPGAAGDTEWASLHEARAPNEVRTVHFIPKNPGDPLATVDPVARTEELTPRDPVAALDRTIEFEERQSVALPTTVDSASARLTATEEMGFSIREAAESGPHGTWPMVAGYQILGELGRGGMGVVYKARQRGLNRLVALKMVLAGAHAGAHLLARFHTEAEAVARLTHPNIVQIYEVGEQDGLPFFSLEFVDGSPLDKKLGGKPQPPREAAQLCATLARAMHFAHQHGIIHRDLKPANVLMTLDGIPKITDFGLAKLLEEEGDSSRTKTGTVMGTPSYMAPEQARGDVREVGTHSDLYSLGALLYECITGKPPFQGPTPMETMLKVTREEAAAPSRLRPDVSRDLETICVKCLQKEPAKRYGNCYELAEDLNRFLMSEPVRARPVGNIERVGRWCRRNPGWAAMWGGIAALLIFVASGSLYAAITINTAKQQADANARIAKKNEEKAKKNEEKAKEFGSAASQAYATLIREVQDKLKDKPALQDLKKQILLPSIKGLESLIVRMGKNQDAFNLDNLADAHLKMGWLYREIGQIDQAYKQFQETHEIRERIALANPNEEDARVQLANSWKDLGDITLHAKGDAAQARADYKRGLTIANDLAEHPKSDQPSLMDRKQVVADLYYKLGDIADGPVEAREYYTQALVRRQEWRNAHPELADPMSRVADCYHDLARASFHSRDQNAARRYFEECLKLREEFLKRQPQSAFGKLILAFEHERMGDFQVRAGQPEQGKNSLQSALARYDELVKADPKNEENKKHLSRATYLLGTAYLRLHDTNLAEENYAKALQMRRELAEKDAANQPKQKDYMVNLARCGFHEAAAKKAEEIYKKSPKDVDTLLNLMRCYALCSAAAGGPTTPTVEQAKLRDTYAASAANCLEQAIANGSRNVVDVETDPDIDAIRNYPAFQRALDKLRESVQPVATPSALAR
jgi:serine/threonine-protein kinase